MTQDIRQTGWPTLFKCSPNKWWEVIPAGAGVAVMKEEYGRSLQILQAVCGLVLLIACSNVGKFACWRGEWRGGDKPR